MEGRNRSRSDRRLRFRWAEQVSQLKQCCLQSCRANQVPALLLSPAQRHGGNASVERIPSPTTGEPVGAVNLSCAENHRSMAPYGLRAGSCLEKLFQSLICTGKGTRPCCPLMASCFDLRSCSASCSAVGVLAALRAASALRFSPIWSMARCIAS